jgi:signal transduction histidine kinase
MVFDLSAIYLGLARSPGDLIYHLVISLALILTILTALSKKGPRARHILVGCSILLFFQILLFSLRMIDRNVVFSDLLVYPSIERQLSAMTVIWLVWTFHENDNRFLLTGLSIFLSLTLVLLTTALLVLGKFLPQYSFIHESMFEILWQVTTLLLILIGIILTVSRRPSQWVVAVAILGTLSMGHILQIINLNTETWQMGSVRLAQTFSLPWLMALVQRLGTPNHDETYTSNDLPTDHKNILVDTKPKLVDLLLNISLQETRDKKLKAIVPALSLSLVSDICYLVETTQEEDNLELIAGYDLIREEYLPAPSLTKDDLPTVMEAWKVNRVSKLSQAQANTQDAATLKALLQYHSIGNLLAYPLSRPDGSLIGGLIFLSPYTNKQWPEESIAFLDEIKENLIEVLFSMDQRESLQRALEQAQINIKTILEEKEKLSQGLVEKDTAIHNMINTIKQLKAKYQIEKIETVKSIEEMRATIKELTSRTESKTETTHQLAQLQQKIQLLSAERDQLNTALTQATARIKDLEKQSGQTGPIRLSMDKQIISLDSITANVRLQISRSLQKKEIDLEIINPDGRQMIKTDPELLQTAITELLHNAIQASIRGGTIQLNQKLSLETGMLVIQVTDFGEGLTQAEQTAFFNADHKSIDGIGSVQSIRDAIRAIRVLNGKIWLRSKKEAFTTFRVQLPVRIID